jgi:hypothetical protein
MEEYIQEKVLNMAIVDMREGYILKIAPVSNLKELLLGCQLNTYLFP